MPGKDFLLVLCNYTTNKNLQNLFLRKPFACETAGDMAGTAIEHTFVLDVELFLHAAKFAVLTKRKTS